MSNYWLDKKKQKEEAEMPQIFFSVLDFEKQLAEEIKKSIEILKSIGNTISSDQVKIVEIPELMIDSKTQFNEKVWELDL